MAGLIERGNTYYAVFYQNGKQIRVSTKVHVKPTVRDGQMTGRMLRQLAQQTADAMERGAKGEISTRQALQAVRAMMSLSKLPKVEDYFAKYEKRAKEKGLKYASTALKTFLKLMPHCASLPLDGVTQAMAEEYVEKALDEVSGSTVDRRLADLSACFNLAIKEELIDRNPFRGVRVPKWSLQGHERQPFSRDDLEKILSTFPGEWPDMVATCLLLGGPRLGDIATMKWEQIDFESALFRMATAKTKRRMVKPIVPPLMVIFRRRRELVGEVSPFVFPYAGAMYKCTGDKTSKLSLEFGKLCRDAGISKKIDSPQEGEKVHAMTDKTFHSLRTTATTFLLDAGTPPELVRYIVGHDDPEIERRHYYRPNPETEAKYITALAGVLGIGAGGR